MFHNQITAEHRERCRRASLFFFLLLCSWISLPALPVSAVSANKLILPKELRVNILAKYNLSEIKINTKRGTFFVGSEKFDIANKAVNISLSKEGMIFISIDKSQSLTTQHIHISFPETYTLTFDEQGASVNRTYRGNLEISGKQKTLQLIAVMKLEDYVAASARAELGRLLAESSNLNKQRELISAMEITLRSFIAAEKNRHRGKTYEFCDLTHCAHFPGLAFFDSSIAESLTAGQVMINERGKPVTAYFHSTCGGVLTEPVVYWCRHETSKNYRRGYDSTNGKDINCQRSPHFSWHVILTEDELDSVIEHGRITSLRANYKQERVTSLSYTAASGYQGVIEASVFISKAGRVFGWNRIKSNLFVIEKTSKGWELSGNGLGHGIGMCQWGAHAMSESGKSCNEILSFYYGSLINVKKIL